MPVTWENEYKGAKVAIWRIEESIESLSHQLAEINPSLEPPAEFKAEQRILQWYAVRLLAKEISGSISINYDDSGRPWPENGYLSISHSHDHVAVIYHSSKAVGVDLQLIDEKVLRIAHKFINEKETPQDIEDHVRIWSIKEAAYKIQGTGSPYFKRDYTVSNLQANEGSCIVWTKEAALTLDFLLAKHDDFILAATVE